MLDFRTETFLTVCKTMNFTKAAKLLHITQPAVSQHIKYLEKVYDVPLFVYHNKELHLTKQGQLLKKRLLTMKNDEKYLHQELKQSEKVYDTLSIGVTMTIGEYAVIHALSEFQKNHENLNLNIFYRNTVQLLRLLKEGTIQFALVEGNYPGAEYEKLNYSTEDYIAVCAKDHPSLKTPAQMKDLIDQRLLVREKGSGTRNILEENLKARGLSLTDFKRYTTVENMHTLIGLLKKDCGISFMYKVAVEEELSAGILREIQLEDFKMKHDFDFIWPKDSIYSSNFYTLCKEIMEYNKNASTT
ncbi:MAG: LysR family transcriptional regulator [Lachnospiraceae bacterium]|nr:LysR family transcriptional regulator [Lachnospiraceae bacterium]